MDREVARILSELHRQGVIPRGLAADSRAIARGEVFLAYPGERADLGDVQGGVAPLLRQTQRGRGEGVVSPWTGKSPGF